MIILACHRAAEAKILRNPRRWPTAGAMIRWLYAGAGAVVLAGAEVGEERSIGRLRIAPKAKEVAGMG